MSPREAVCQYMGWEFSEASDNRYQYGRSAVPVYSTSTGLVCAVDSAKKPPASDRDGNLYNWVEATGSNAEYVKARGKTVYESNGTI